MKRMSLTVSEECSSLVFYDIDKSAQSRNGFFSSVLSFFDRSLMTTVVASIASNKSSKSRSRRDDWQKLDSPEDILTLGSNRKITRMTLVPMIDHRMIPMSDYLLYASWSSDFMGGVAYIAVRSSIRSLIDWVGFSKGIVDALLPSYGFGNRRNHSADAVCFPIGLGVGLGYSSEDFYEGDRISGWVTGLEHQVFNHGMIRDVFELNFLNKSQLDFPLGRTTLKKWIEKDSSRGRLSPVGGDLTLWEVGMKHQPLIFRELFNSDLIFDRDRHKYWFHGGTKLEPADRIALRDKARKKEFNRLAKEWGPKRAEKWLNDRGW